MKINNTLWRCIEQQHELKPGPRQISTAANQKSDERTAANQTSDERTPVDYSPAFKLENNSKNKKNCFV
jgi:hypothetical protein